MIVAVVVELMLLRTTTVYATFRRFVVDVISEYREIKSGVNKPTDNRVGTGRGVDSDGLWWQKHMAVSNYQVSRSVKSSM